jgi:ATP/maltotriose-dependent transcriptional regulator MalT/DNA-binding SARP family transcriptional activator
MQTNLAKMHTEGLAKTMRPSASKVIKRKRLFRRLDASRKYPLVWISGPAGSGKTTLVSSFIEDQESVHLWYKFDSSDIDISSFFFNMAQASKKNGQKRNNLPVFTSEYRLGIPEFTQNFFAALFSSFSEKTLIVFDNYQELPDDLIFHDLLIDVINLLPENLQVIIISRKEPSSKFSRFKANRMINQIGWQDLRFSSKEFFDVVSRWGFEELPEKKQIHIYEKMDGWIAGLLFMLEGTKKYNTSLQNIGSGTFEEIFHYFAEEIFDFQVNNIKYFLLLTSLLPNITPKFVQVLTGDNHINKILSYLNSNNLFIEKLAQSDDEVYLYHPLFKNYLQHKMVDHFTPDELKEIKRKTANLLLIENQTEKAAELLIMAEDFNKFIEIVVSQAPILMNQGRHSLLEEWLEKIPAELFIENPCLFYWSGVCKQKTDQSSAKESFRQAFDVACDQKNTECAFSSWAGLVDAIIHQWHDFTELDHLIDWFEKNYDKESDRLSNESRGRIAACMAESLLIRDPGNENLEKWIEYATDEALSSKNIELSMQAYLVAANYYLWQGNQSQSWWILSQIRKLARSPRMSSLYVLKSKCLEATMYAWFMADAEKCLLTVESALDISRSTGVHVIDHNLYVIGAFGALIAKKYNKMAHYLKRIETLLDSGRQHCFFCHHYLSAWFSMSRGNILRGITHAEEALQTAAKTGHIYHKALGVFVLAQVLFEKGKFSCANKKLKEFEEDIEQTNSQLLQYMFYLSKAHFSLDLGKEEVGIKYLGKALKLGNEEKYQNILSWWNPSVMTRLSMKAIERKIEVEYVKDMINLQGIIPGESPIEIEQWPWPIKIYTLGRFEIVKDGKPFRFSGKAQQKPLAMLKALIALGGRGVSEEFLADALWPDADGDMQHQSLATTLHRLRKILGGKDMIDFQDGHLSINSNYVWVDVWAFERLLSQAEKEINKNEKRNILFGSKYAEKAINLYNGGFLTQNSRDHWCIRLRERLKSRFLRGVILLGRSFEKQEKCEKAVNYYLQALEIDPLVEEFYQRLMICYHRMGRDAEAVLVYKKCQKNLQCMLNVEPSIHTKAINNNLISKPQNKLNQLKIKGGNFSQM